MFRTVTTFLTAVTDLLDGALVGDPELETEEFRQWHQANPDAIDGRWRALWDARAQDEAFLRSQGTGAPRDLERTTPLLGWSADLQWLDGPHAAVVPDPRSLPGNSAIISVMPRSGELAELEPTAACTAEGRAHPLDGRYELSARRAGAVPPRPFGCDLD